MMQGLALTPSARGNCTCWQQSSWLGLTSAILPLLFSLLIYFKWYLLHAIDSRVRAECPQLRVRCCRPGPAEVGDVFSEQNKCVLTADLTTAEDNA